MKVTLKSFSPQYLSANSLVCWSRKLCVALVVLICASDHALAQRTVKLERSRAQVMLKAISRHVQKGFYDPQLKGLEWNKLVAQVSEQIEVMEVPGEMFSVLFGLVNSLQDSHTVFAPPRRSVRYRFGFEAQAFGDEILVSEVEEGGAAASAGLQPGDRVLQINGFNADRGSFDLMMLFFRALRPVSEMNLVVQNDGESPKTVRIVGDAKREALVTDLTDIDNIYQLIREAELNRAEFSFGDVDDQIGYLKLGDFRGDKQELKWLAKKLRNSPAMIVDLRGNPGGAVSALRYFLGFFEQEKKVILDLVRRDETEPFEIKPQRPELTGPLYILVDSRTSSAAEIFARHFQRTGRARVIGDRTSGRVTVARFYPLEVGAGTVVVYGLQVAVGRVVFRGGEELEGSGVKPDEFCVPSGRDLREGDDPCFRKAIVMARAALRGES